MEKGLIFALVASIFFAGNAVTVRRATFQAKESFTATAYTMFVGIPFFAIIIFFSGEWGRILAVNDSFAWNVALLTVTALPAKKMEATSAKIKPFSISIKIAPLC